MSWGCTGRFPGSARSADELAGEAGCRPRLMREWLDRQAAAELVEYDAETDRYSLGAEAGLRVGLRWKLPDPERDGLT